MAQQQLSTREITEYDDSGELARTYIVSGPVIDSATVDDDEKKKKKGKRDDGGSENREKASGSGRRIDVIVSTYFFFSHLLFPYISLSPSSSSSSFT